MDDFAVALMKSTIPAIVAGILTAVVSVRLALSRFRQERWFERKAEAYADLLAALSDIGRSASVRLAKIEEGRTYEDAYVSRLEQRASEGYTRIRSAAALGAFLFSTESATRLEQLERELDHADDPNLDLHDVVSIHHDAAMSALRDFRPLAKRDLMRPW